MAALLGGCWRMSCPGPRPLVLPLSLVPVEALVPRDVDLQEVEVAAVAADDGDNIPGVHSHPHGPRQY